MQKIDSESSLRDEIRRLENKQLEEEKSLKDHFLIVYESAKPGNLILNTIREIGSSPEIREDLINTTIGLTTGYISKLLFVRGTNNPVKRLFGDALMFGITNLVAKNPETVKSIGKGLIKIFKGRHERRIHSA